MRNQGLGKIGAGLAVAGAGVAAAYVWGIRPWHLRWGATDEELRQPLLGDELAPHPKLKATHAITINSPAADVWPWLVQMGQNRGGFYSYTWLENPCGSIRRLRRQRWLLLSLNVRSCSRAGEHSFFSRLMRNGHV